MAKYKVVIGTHVEGGKAYSKGQTVNSPLELTRLFPGKFTKLEVAEPEPVPRPAAKGEPDWEEPAAAPAKATRTTKSKAH